MSAGARHIAPLLRPSGSLDWQDRAACLYTDPEVFFPEKGVPATEARRICRGCEVRAECLAYALVTYREYGIWGGTSEQERRKLRAAA